MRRSLQASSIVKIERIRQKIDLNEKLKVSETDINFICIIVNDSQFRVEVES